MEPVDVDDLALPVDDDEDREVLHLREVEPAVVVLVLLGVPELARGALADVSEDLARALEELAAVLLAEDALGEAGSFGLDELRVEVRVRRRGVVPRSVVGVVALAPAEGVLEPALPAGS